LIRKLRVGDDDEEAVAGHVGFVVVERHVRRDGHARAFARVHVLDGGYALATRLLRVRACGVVLLEL
jgi:hypothetical protein